MHRTRSKNLGKLFRFSKSLPEARARPRERHTAPSGFSLRQGVEEFLWRRKHVGRRSDRSRRQPKRPGRAADYAISPARLKPAGFSTRHPSNHARDFILLRLLLFRSLLSPRKIPDDL